MVEFLEKSEPARVGTAPVARRKTPRHLWAVGALSLAWNLIGATDYTLSQLRNRTWIEAGADTIGITAAEMIAYIDSLPAWLHAFWALGVWGAVAGSILLMLRSRHAIWSFAASLLGLAVTQFYRLLAPQPEWVGEDLALNLALWSIATFLLIYAVSMRDKRVLR